ncbi:MAG: hypothetical protein ACI4OU_01995 [Candidatus Enterenecus sp.]
MAVSASPMQLLVSIVERGKGTSLIKYYQTFRVIYHNQAVGRGTAASHLLDTLGFGTAERDILLSAAPRDTIRQLMRQLKDDDRSKLGAPGIAFSLNISGMTAALAVGLSRVEKLDPERGEQIMEQGNHHSLILVAVNQGYTDAVMDTARAAGARGGTVIRARWTGAGEVEKFVGITLQSEKEVLAIVAANQIRNAIMEEINQAHGLDTPAQAVVISLPIDHTARLD